VVRSEVLDVGKEDGKLLALVVIVRVLLSAENALVNLRRRYFEIFIEIPAREVVGAGKLLIEPRMRLACRFCIQTKKPPSRAASTRYPNRYLNAKTLALIDCRP